MKGILRKKLTSFINRMRSIINRIIDNSVEIYTLIFVLSAASIFTVSRQDYDLDFWENVKVEAHGIYFQFFIRIKLWYNV